MILSPNFSSKSVVILTALFICLSGTAGASDPAVSAAKQTPVNGQKHPIAVLPIDNLSGMPAPLADIEYLLINDLKNKGVNILDEKVLEAFITRHRIRYVGGITHSIARAFRKETGAGSVLITSLELYYDESPPKTALTTRLVSTGEKASILWMGGLGAAGNEAPGLLGLSSVEDPKRLLKKTIEALTGSLHNYLSGGTENHTFGRKARKFRPKEVYNSPVISPDLKYRVVVLPLFNASERKNAGNIMGLHFVRYLKEFKNFEVIEPGVERQARLDLRIIMDGGISLPHADLIFRRLDSDLILTGYVSEYQDYRGSSGRTKVAFSAMLIEKKSREIVWSSRSYHEGDDRVIFFNLGKVNTAHTLASMMVQNAVGLIF